MGGSKHSAYILSHLDQTLLCLLMVEGQSQSKGDEVLQSTLRNMIYLTANKRLESSDGPRGTRKVIAELTEEGSWNSKKHTEARCKLNMGWEDG